MCTKEKPAIKTGAVLAAAGLSSRMHAYKPLLPYGGSTVAKTVVTRLREAGAVPIVVVTGYRAEELEQHLSGCGVRFVRNADYRDTDMFTSLKLGLRKICGDCERVLIQPLDVVQIKAETVRTVMQTDAPIVRPISGGKPGHPILLDSALIPQICSFTGQGGLKGALEHCGAAIAEPAVEDDGIWQDIDTPEDYRDLLNREQQKMNTGGHTHEKYGSC